jgi:hypothetical protein
MSACVLSFEPAIMFPEQLVKQRYILIGKTALANDAARPGSKKTSSSSFRLRGIHSVQNES